MINLPFLVFLLALVTGIPSWLRYRRNARASRRLAAQDDADTLLPRDRLAVALAYPHETITDGRVHETQGAFGVTGASARDRRIYIGDLWVRVHESLLDAIAPYCTARVVRAWDKALVVELNGVPVLPTLADSDTADYSDAAHDVRLLDERRERSADYRLRLSDDGLESGCLRVMSAGLIGLGAVIVMLALPSLHPVRFGLGCLPLAWGFSAIGRGRAWACTTRASACFGCAAACAWPLPKRTCRRPSGSANYRAISTIVYCR